MVRCLPTVTILVMAKIDSSNNCLYQADLVNLEPVRAQINRDVTNFAEELTEVVGVRIINQT